MHESPLILNVCISKYMNMTWRLAQRPKLKGRDPDVALLKLQMS